MMSQVMILERLQTHHLVNMLEVMEVIKQLLCVCCCTIYWGFLCETVYWMYFACSTFVRNLNIHLKLNSMHYVFADENWK